MSKLLACLMLLLSISLSAQTVKIYSSPFTEDATYKYYLKLIAFVLEKSTPEYPKASLELHNITEYVTYARVIKMLKTQEIDIFWAGTSIDMENEFLPIRIPINKGLLGYRTLIIHKDNLAKFQLLTQDELKLLTACQGDTWVDSDILEFNNYNTLRIGRLDLMYKLLNKKRCDYFPRAIYEAPHEIDNVANIYPNLMLFDEIILKYKYPLYFFVNRSAGALASQIEHGLRKAVDDGSLVNFILTNDLMKSVYPIEQWKGKRYFLLDNPQLPAKTPIDDKSLWLDLVNH